MKSDTVHSEITPSTINGMFWAHLFVTSLAWIGPFLFWWPLMIFAYCMVQLQYKLLNKCIMNEGHALKEENNNTFYHFLLTKMGFRLDKSLVKFVVRKRLNIFLGLFVILWQVVLGFKPLLF